MQRIVGDFPQQVVKFLFNCNPLSTDAPNVFLRNIEIGPKTWPYFKFGRSQGIGGIKPEVALGLYQSGLVYNPQTGQRDTIPNLHEGWMLGTINVPNYGWIEGEEGVWELGIRKHPWARLQMIGRLANQSWSIEYLAAHLEAGRIFAGLSSSDDSPDALRQMYAYHYNLDKTLGWDNPATDVYEYSQIVLDLMPKMINLLYSN